MITEKWHKLKPWPKPKDFPKHTPVALLFQWDQRDNIHKLVTLLDFLMEEPVYVTCRTSVEVVQIHLYLLDLDNPVWKESYEWCTKGHEWYSFFVPIADYVRENAIDDKFEAFFIKSMLL